MQNRGTNKGENRGSVPNEERFGVLTFDQAGKIYGLIIGQLIKTPKSLPVRLDVDARVLVSWLFVVDGLSADRR